MFLISLPGGGAYLHTGDCRFESEALRGLVGRAPLAGVLGVVPVGYGDGYPRALSDGGRVRAAGRLVPVVGTVCMDATMVDLTDVPEARPGLEVTLIEAESAGPIGAAAVAEAAGTIPYEILTGIGKRVPRVYR